MFSAMRRRLHFSPATVVAGLALVFAMSGGAYAAKKYLITSTKQISPSVLKALQGKAGVAGAVGAPGAAGAQGPAGPAGPAGPKGETGSSGKEGKQGEPGKAGKDGVTGKSVEGVAIAPGDPGCEGRGGVEYAIEGSTESKEVCTGKEGSPWTAGGTLPPGATETGAWSFNASEASSIAPGAPMGNGKNHTVFVPISFSVPLSAPITESAKIHFVGETGDGVNCKGTVKEPKALPGQLCIYWAEYENAEFNSVRSTEYISPGTSKAGAFIQFEEVKDGANGAGSWAVTGG
jgi:hypothetical protein